MVLVESGVHLFGVTIGAVPIQGDGDMVDEFTQTRLVVRSNTFLGFAACAVHAATLGHVCDTGHRHRVWPAHQSQVDIRTAGPPESLRQSGCLIPSRA